MKSFAKELLEQVFRERYCKMCIRLKFFPVLIWNNAKPGYRITNIQPIGSILKNTGISEN